MRASTCSCAALGGQVKDYPVSVEGELHVEANVFSVKEGSFGDSVANVRTYIVVCV